MTLTTVHNIVVNIYICKAKALALQIYWSYEKKIPFIKSAWQNVKPANFQVKALVALVK